MAVGIELLITAQNNATAELARTGREFEKGRGRSVVTPAQADANAQGGSGVLPGLSGPCMKPETLTCRAARPYGARRGISPTPAARAGRAGVRVLPVRPLTPEAT